MVQATVNISVLQVAIGFPTAIHAIYVPVLQHLQSLSHVPVDFTVMGLLLLVHQVKLSVDYQMVEESAEQVSVMGQREYGTI